MRQIWLFLVALLVIWPVSWEAAEISDKSIELIPSDVLFACMPLIYLLARTKPTKAQLNSVPGKAHVFPFPAIVALVFIIYCMSLAGIGLGMSGEKVRIYSAFKLAKPFSFVILGTLMGSWVDPFDFLEMIGRAFGVVVAITMFCTVTDPSFPFGDWGRVFLETEVTGYPNSGMSFYGCLVPLLLASADCSRQFLFKLLMWGLSACCAMIILGSMSRSSTIVMVLGVAIYLVMTGRAAVLAVSSVVVAVVSVIGFGLFSAVRDTEVATELMIRIQTRLDRSVESEDPSSGRFDIWQLAIELWAENPIFGYLFESFSHYSEFDTPHQQYLEVLHKCGFLGLVIYLATIGGCLAAATRLIRMVKKNSAHQFQLQAVRAMLIAVLIGNLTQPNLTFSLTGNFLFLIFGCLCSARAVIAVSKPVKAPATKPVQQVQAPVLRIAG